MFTLTQTSTQTAWCNAKRRFLLQLHVNTGDMGNLQNQNTMERKAVESVKKDTGMGEVNGVIVPATTGMVAGTAGLAGDAGLTGTEAQKVMSGNTVIGAGLVPKEETVVTANAAEGIT